MHKEVIYPLPNQYKVKLGSASREFSSRTCSPSYLNGYIQQAVEYNNLQFRKSGISRDLRLRVINLWRVFGAMILVEIIQGKSIDEGISSRAKFCSISSYRAQDERKLQKRIQRNRIASGVGEKPVQCSIWEAKCRKYFKEDGQLC